MKTSRTSCGKQSEKDEKGAVLLLLVFLVAFSSLMVGTLLRSIVSDFQIMNNLLFSTQALHVAEAGIDHAISMIRDDENWDKGFDEVELLAGSRVNYTVTVENDHPRVVVTSTGAVQGYMRTIEVVLLVFKTTRPYPIRIMSWKEV
jgi:type II secretory pathway component PulK